MKIYQNSLNFNTSGSLDILDVTPNVTEELTKSKISDGFVNLFIPGSTAAVTTIEYESGVLLELDNRPRTRKLVVKIVGN